VNTRGTIISNHLDFEDARILAWFKTGLKHETIRLAKKKQNLVNHEPLTLNEPLDRNAENDNTSMIDIISSDSDIQTEVESSIFIQNALSMLTTRQKTIIVSTILYDITEKETANALSVSQPAVHQTKERALNKLRALFY